ncbi:hypothetical protein [Pseudomonas sp. 21]|uniref:hypothetical protein n=1 Tax=Pseudomonas sp. 21 TaxID=1619948 RepID=UPI00210B357E|nr:hypothetical protein [Pseudomonas sp. 21]
MTVQTLGDHASGAMVSRQYKSETATLDLKDSSISTQGMGSHGLRAESGGALSASNSAVSTQGKQATGVFANNTASARLDGVSVNTQGDFGHGVVARQGGSVDA